MQSKQWNWTIVLLLTERDTFKNAGIWLNMLSFLDFLIHRAVDWDIKDRYVKMGDGGKILAMAQRWIFI